MAIGKAGAYATVTAPNVDFGKIALNAQQAQQADFEMIKSMIPKPEKKEKFESEKLPGNIKSTSNSSYDSAMVTIVDEATTKVSDITKTAESRGYYTQDEKTEINKQNNAISGYNDLAALFSDKTVDYSKKIQEGVFSPIDSGRQDYIQKIAEKKNVDVKRDENGQFIFRVVATDDEGNELRDENNKPVYEKFNDRGVEKDYILQNELQNGSVFNKAIKEFDSLKYIGAMQNNLKLRTSVVDANGTFTRTKTFLNDEDYNSVDNAVKRGLSNYDNLSSYLYSLDNVKYATPKTMDQYEKDGDLDFAKKEMRKGVLAGLGFQNKEDRIAPKSVTNINVGGVDTKPNYVTPEISEIKVSSTGKTAKGGSKEGVAGYTLTIDQKDDIAVGALDANLQGVGYDNFTKNFFIDYYKKIGKSDKTSDVSSETRQDTQVKRIWLTGKESNLALANTIIKKLSYLENGETKKYKDSKQLINYIKQQDPGGKYFGKKTTSKGVGAKYNDK